MKSVYWIFGAGLLLGACGDDGGGSGQLVEAREVGVAVDAPFDASPSPTADAVYFTGMSVEDAGVLYRLGTAAQSAPMMLASGFTAPTSVVVATAGDRVYVSDLGSAGEDDSASGGGGVIYAVPAGGGDKAALAGTAGYGARSLDLVAEGKAGDVLYFSGVNPETGAAGVYRLPLGEGGAVEAVHEGGDLRELSGVAVTSDGDVYVIDTIGSSGAGSLIKVAATGEVSELVVGLRVGYPAGIALTRDESFVLISGVNPERGSSQVYRVELADPSFENIEVVDMGISQNTESAGLHRAHEVDNYAWADNGGTVYLLGTKAKALP